MTKRITGRHRRPGRLSTTTNNLTRSAAIAATSTGLLAGTAVSATAIPEVGHEPVSLVQEPSAAPAESLQRLIEAGLLSEKAIAFDSPARAVAAPADVDGVDFGTSGFTAVTRVVEAPAEETPAEAPAETTTETAAAAAVESRTETTTETAAAAAVESRTETSASRDNARTSPSAPATPAPSTPAPQPAPAPEPAPAPSGGVLGIAAAYVGTPYVSGGSSPATGFDCSGYTSFVFGQAGISLPRTAAAQQAAATPVSNPQPGDLVFFGYPAYHVGIYAGGGMMYDSGNPGTGTVYRAVFAGVSGYGRV